eukprot:2009285-Pleurochrysis_carterae.AAC.2
MQEAPPRSHLPILKAFLASGHDANAAFQMVSPITMCALQCNERVAAPRDTACAITVPMDRSRSRGYS